MLIKGFMLVILIQMIFFFIKYKVKINNRKIKALVDKLYIYDSFIMISYLIFCIVLIIFANTGFYKAWTIKITFSLMFLLVIPSNVFKIISHYSVKFNNRKYDDLEQNIEFLALIGIVVTIVMSFIVFLHPESSITTKLIERIEFSDVQIREVKNNKENVLQLVLINSSNENYILQDDKLCKEIIFTNNKDKFLEKYEVKEISQNAFGNRKVKVYHNYTVGTSITNEKFLIENFLKNN